MCAKQEWSADDFGLSERSDYSETGLKKVVPLSKHG